MMRLQQPSRVVPAVMGLMLASSALYTPGALADEGESDGNRYFLERYYLEDISAARAFLESAPLKYLVQSVIQDGEPFDPTDRLIILDVRDATEYKLGHPRGAYHMPYPRIYRECVNDTRPEDGGGCTEGTVQSYNQDPEDLFDMVEQKFPIKDQRLATLCRTGYRSVLAANILSKPEKVICDLKHTADGEPVQPDYDNCVVEYAGRGYTQVSNIQQGFVGQPKSGVISSSGNRYVVGEDQTLEDLELPDGTEAKGFVAFDLDLNNDGTVDANDKDGWRYHQGLPYTTRLAPFLKNAQADAMGFYDLP
jgi:rhodanese-related sulfurtransferase